MKFSRHILVVLTLICLAVWSSYALLRHRSPSLSNLEYTVEDKTFPIKLTPITLPSKVYDLAIPDAGQIWAIGLDKHDSRLIWHSTDEGNSWQVIAVPNNGWVLRAVQFADQQYGWAVGSYNLMIRTSDGGNSWKQVKLPVDGAVNKLHFFNPKIGLVAASTGYYDKKTNISTRGLELLWTNDGGDTWIVCYKDSELSDVFDIAASSEKNVIVSLNGDKLLRTEDGGKTWQIVVVLDRLSRKSTFNSVIFAPNGVGWAVGDEGIFYRSVNMGKTWQQPQNLPQSFSQKNWQSIAFYDTKKGIVIAEDGTLALTEDAGDTWSEVGIKVKGSPYSIKLYKDKGIILGIYQNYKVALDSL